MSHGGPLTLAQKRMMAMRSENAANAPDHMPLLPAIYHHSSSASTSPRAATDNQPLASFDDIEMKDISAPTSIADSPPANYSHLRPQPSFSAAAKPFMPPGVADPTTETMPSPSTTPMKRLPPHRVLQTKTPNNSAAIPIVKPEPPAAPALTAQSAHEPPVRRAGPHAKLGPHARKVGTRVQSDVPSTVQVQEDRNDIQQTPDPDTWASVQEPQVVTEAAQGESSPIHQETQVKAEAAPVAEESTTLESPPSTELQAPAAQQSVTPSNQVNQVTRHIGPNKWLAMLNDLKDPEKGCELILAIADHLRTSIESRELNSPKELIVLMENTSGQRMPAKVDSEMIVSDMIKQCASYINVNESDIEIILKINKGPGDQTQESEEL